VTVETDGNNKLILELRRDVEMSHGNTDLQQLILRYGRWFNPVPRPKGIEQRQAKGCFLNSLLIAADEGQAFYVEGFAMKTGLRIPFHHAWNTRNGIDAFDTTLVDSSDCLYLGIAIPTKLALDERFADDEQFPLLDARKSFGRMEDLLKLALSNPPNYDKFKQTDE
jgi:hypothetical protein